MAWVMGALQLAGGAYTAMNEREEGLEARTEKNVQAVQRERNAQQSRAYATRRGNEERKQAKLLQSAVIARAPGESTDGSVEKIIGDIGAEGEYRALLQIYGGGEEARGMEAQADMDRREGENYRRAGKRRATTTLLNSGASSYDAFMKYG